MKKCFANKMNETTWQQKLKQMIPSYDESLGKDAALCKRVREWTSNVLQLKVPELVH